MTSLRDARANAIRRRHRDLDDNFEQALLKILDDLEEIDREHAAPVIKLSRTLTEDEAAALRAIENGPAKPSPRRRTRT